MSFYGTTFTFDNISSDTYGLYIAQIGNKGVSNSSGGSDIDIIKQKVHRNPRYSIQGAEQSTPLEFSLSFFSESALTRTEVEQIQKWLFGHLSYKQLRINQCDMLDVHYNCILKSPEIITVGNLVYGFSCTVECDAPWGWGADGKYKKSVVPNPHTFKYYNGSDNNDYEYATIEFTTLSAGDVSIKNETDNRETVFTNLVSDETINCDSELQIIKSNTGLNRLGNFNFKWFRLVPGWNTIVISGSIENFTLAHRIAKKVGS